MIQKKNIVSRIAIYALLVFGAVVFSFPFVWMITTSMKVDRELFPEDIQVLPMKPNARTVSPFVDSQYYERGVSELSEPYLDTFEKVLNDISSPSDTKSQDTVFNVPEFVDRQMLIKQMARGLAKRMESMTPPEVWTRGEKAVEEETRKNLDVELLRSILDNVYRRMLLGRVTVRSYHAEEETLNTDKPVYERFGILTPDTVSLYKDNDKGTSCALVRYDFTKDDSWKITVTGTTEFDLSDLYRIQLFMRADDNWHKLNCYVEKLGVLYKSKRSVFPANYDWLVVTFQEPGPDDLTNKIRTWIHLEEIDRGPQYEADPHTLKMTLELKKSSQLEAWYGKCSRNYYLTCDHIPILRYLATSFYLVILNVLLSVFSCSMVAYSIARLKWPGRDFSFLLMLATLMVPIHVTMIPTFLVWKYLGCYNTLTPLWLGSAFAAPFNVFLLRQFFKSIPKDLEEAARIDGASHFRIYWNIMVPLIRPALIIVGIFTFLATWNNFLGPLIYIADQRLYPLAFGLYAFSIQVTTAIMISNNSALIMAGSFIMTLPIIIVFFIAQKYFIQGITLTGLKG
jgi:ABC-type glycerol-3-phosphate transport system permease component